MLQLPSQVAVVKCLAHQTSSDVVAVRNSLAGATAKQLALAPLAPTAIACVSGTSPPSVPASVGHLADTQASAPTSKHCVW